MEKANFISALPVWAKGLEEEWNTHLVLVAQAGKNAADTLRIATHGFYQLFINDNFVSYGPARAGRGYFRVDELEIKDLLTEETNKIEIILVSYGVANYSCIVQPPFVTCEIVKDKKAVCATGNSGFKLLKPNNYYRSISRLSYQRGFAEAYRIDDLHKPEEVETVICDEKNYIARGIKYASHQELYSEGFIYRGDCHREIPEEYIMLQSDCFEDSQKFMPPEVDMTKELQELKYYSTAETSGETVFLKNGEFAVSSFAYEATGMIAFTVKCNENTTIYVAADETLRGKTVNPQRINGNMAIKYELVKGVHRLMNFEPMSMKYVSFTVFGGDVEISDVRIVEYKHREINKSLNTDDEKLKMIYDASVETYRQNTVDIFMDCPSRERAGYLCDSFFTSRAEKYLTGENLIEKNFLENFLMEENFKYLPEGIFPMCYPAEQRDGIFIPNWAMWLVLEVSEYSERNNDGEISERYRPRFMKLYDYFKKFENNDGLLEKVEGWVFVDWSQSNQQTQDVNFPTNMMYAYMLEKMGEMYKDTALIEKSEKIREKIRELSFEGNFFCDNLIITENGYEKSGVCTESCQYYAFFTKTATPDTYPELWNILTDEFGPGREEKGLYKEIGKSNAFVGNFIRLEILAREGLWEKLLEEISGYFGYMAERTGTLWEKIDASASMNHGFASHISFWIDMCIGNM